MDELLASKIKPYFTLCLANGIDEAMRAMEGPDWFSAFVASEADEEFPIVGSANDSAFTLDMQALLKLLYYRRDRAETILTYYGFLSREPSFDNEQKQRQLRSLLHNLINLYRNGMDAHPTAAAIQRRLDNDSDSLYSYEDAVRNMLSVARVFRDVTDENGVSYYDTMKELADRHKADASKTYYPVAATAEQEGFDDADAVFQACMRLKIPVATVRDVPCFATDNYSHTIARIREHLEAASAKKQARRAKKRGVLIAVITSLAAACCVAVVTACLLIPSATPAYNNFDAEYEHLKDRIDALNDEQQKLEHDLLRTTTVTERTPMPESSIVYIPVQGDTVTVYVTVPPTTTTVPKATTANAATTTTTAATTTTTAGGGVISVDAIPIDDSMLSDELRDLFN